MILNSPKENLSQRHGDVPPENPNVKHGNVQCETSTIKVHELKLQTSHYYATKGDGEIQTLRHTGLPLPGTAQITSKVGKSHDSDAESFTTASSSCNDDIDSVNNEDEEGKVDNRDGLSRTSIDNKGDAILGCNENEPTFHMVERLEKQQSASRSDDGLGSISSPSALVPSSLPINDPKVSPYISTTKDSKTDNATKTSRFESVMPTSLSSVSRPSSWLAEGAIRASAPFLLQWLPQIGATDAITEPQQPQLPSQAHSRPLPSEISMIEGQLTPVICHQDLDKGTVTNDLENYNCQYSVQAETPNSQCPSPPWSYFQSRFGSAYRASIGSWCESIMAPSSASLLSNLSKLDEEIPQYRTSPTSASLGLSEDGITQGAVGTTNTTTLQRVSGVATMERLAGLVLSTGHATLGYLTDTVAPATMDIAQRGASSTMDFFSTRLHTVPRLFGGDTHETNNFSTSNQDQLTYASDGESSIRFENERGMSNDCEINRQRSRSAPNLITGLQEQYASGPHQDRQRRSTDPTISTMFGNNTVVPSRVHNTQHGKKSSRHRRQRYPLQTLPGPEGLDPEIRRQLEAEGLSSLGLVDEREARAMRSCWDPRRYGLPKYIIFNQFRTPRPCTTILLMILIVCIVFPVVFRR
ncbi:hypothetical protein BGZ79_002624 [Entomortierella chlamydospora]|nr:hypothetical protein BGZ79_002624 [Entomortierella chlamydospora]